ncbi:MAG: VTT domain-containing protein [Candidatus Pacebacteria bacterium]|nr:VTT domain-containing protein [Candidatus Paceibacterota bacterium]
MLTIGHIADFALLHVNIAYILVILGVILEGEIVVILAGIFSHLGSINIFIAFGVTVFAGVIKSIIGYNLGVYLQKRYPNSCLLNKAENQINLILPKFNKKPFWSIFLSRFLVFGLYWFALIFAGYKKIKIKIFVKAEIFSLLVWSSFMLLIGFIFSQTALSASHNVRNFLGMILIFFIGFFILEKIVAFFVKLFENKIS